MKKVLICGMLLGLLTATGFAQHGRPASTATPIARSMPLPSTYGGGAASARGIPQSRTTGAPMPTVRPGTTVPANTSAGSLTTIPDPATKGRVPQSRTPVGAVPQSHTTVPIPQQ